LRIRVLGSAAGGGFPQWNCGCENCRGVRTGAISATPRTQESVALSADGESWFLLNASPEIRQQLDSFPPLHPRVARQSPVAGIFLTNGDLDHCLGLLSLRESEPLKVYATERVARGFTQNNVLYRTLERFSGQVSWTYLGLDIELPLPGGLTVRAVAAPGKVALHLEGIFPPSAEDNVGLLFRHTASGRTLAYFPSVAAPTPELEAALASADCVFLDGTFFTEDELITLGLGSKKAAQMGHWPVAISQGWLARQRASRKILIHINNTNPLLRDDSKERRALGEAGIEVAYDGMEISL
jgi:pyrroloquinoline quinone biosynthesis protein B